MDEKDRGGGDEAQGGTRSELSGASRDVVHLRYRVAEAYWLITLGHAQRAAGEAEASLESYQRSAALHRRLGDPSREALAWQGAGEAYREAGRSDEAAAFLRRAAASHRDLGDAWHDALALDALATTLAEADPGTARQHWAEARRLLAGHDDPRAARVRAGIERRLADPPTR
ncbi:tetratricopeptide repeat protein [Streptomyces sp. PT12]|uniref:tetratricopeptide repeat protein n=1 Tax=Streptomyces sp. PT12 TaxID=1510197 RepID=UPI000DE407F5|nr:tetratricopeptide repeat protein [Streptomyces sp. PT12]RBM04489.1 hypothetical protein DEH69_30435 [Streptomyces sp. PT12]